jgi:hypothetical protein
VVVSGMAEKTPPKIIKILPNGYFIAHYKWSEYQYDYYKR